MRWGAKRPRDLVSVTDSGLTAAHVSCFMDAHPSPVFAAFEIPSLTVYEKSISWTWEEPGSARGCPYPGDLGICQDSSVHMI